MSTEVKNENAPKEEEEVVADAVVPEDSSSDEATGKKVPLAHQAEKFPMRFVSFNLFGSELSLNPFTSFFGFAFLWGLSVWCMAVPTQADDRLADWNDAVAAKVRMRTTHHALLR